VRMREELIAYLETQGAMPLPFYPDFAKTDDPTSGFVLTVYSPRFSTGYFPQRNRYTVLVETHSWKPNAHRVRLSRNTILGLVQLIDRHGAKWLTEAQAADEAAARLGGTPVDLDYASSWREPGQTGRASTERETAGARTIDFKGYAYSRTPSAFSGELVTKYDPTTPAIWRVPLRDAVTPSVTVTAPKGGYLVPSGYAAQIGARLDCHGIRYQALGKALLAVMVEAFRAKHVTFASTPFEGRMRATIDGAWGRESRSIGSGALYVAISQPLARLVMALLEPQAPDSFAAWGFFNASFEQKEQLEPYVAEMVAEEIAAAHPELRKEFERRLNSDAVFAADPAARLEFFWRRHASWDEQLNLYPVFRIEAAP
jgi:hypothetical protein